MADDVIAQYEAEVQADPGAVGPRLALAGALIATGRGAESFGHLGKVLEQVPGHPAALALITQATSSVGAAPVTEAPATTAGQVPSASSSGAPAAPRHAADPQGATGALGPDVDGADGDDDEDDDDDVDWSLFEEQIGGVVPAPFVTTEDGVVYTTAEEDVAILNPGGTRVTLADVGGLDEVKKRLNDSFLEPMKHPEIAAAFGKSLRGGLLLYGPPGCGKTFIARAVAGELGARFLTVSMADILSSFMGESEKNVRAVFTKARELSPTVLFIDELDAVAGKRSNLGGAAWLKSVVNQLLLEFDGVSTQNEGLFVLAATNHPWDVDEAFLRPGRFDRTLLVLPPDEPARDAILRHHLSKRPIAGIDLGWVVDRTEGFSGADLAFICDTAAEIAMNESIRSGQVAPIGMPHVVEAMRGVKSSTTPWLESSRNVVEFANESGRYDDLKEYLRSRKML
ncbi:AAA family ATPase [uncultured Frigoribacterium sp.]|uniref:AAA family ATPase n=1 Tax=uncultured Frigoribacterium sp. TaxID=335377 RepID=UPI0028D44EE5|nr:AAA family ATPase [uncultured Frigoribacterium sp.]